ncbi:MAG: PKD domain-containing protein, partial [Flavobacteriales bacterium]
QKVFTINVNDVNESPIYYDGSVSIAENLVNTSNVFATLASDEDAAQALSFSIVSGNTNGAFAINASNGMISVANSSALNFEVNPVFNLVIRATDNGLGTLYDDALIVISLLDLNDSPVITVPGAKIVNEFTNLNITSISVADEDVGADSLLVSLSVSHGKLSLSSSAGLRFVLGNGSSNSAMQFYGKLSAINVAFTSIIYISDDDYVGSELLSMDVDDLGHNGSGGAQSSSKTIAITVNPIAVSFNVQTVGATICQTRHHLFYVQTSGTNPMTYQWKHNGAPVVGATNDSLQIANADAVDAGTYQCEVTNPAGVFNSTLVNLTVNATPEISFSSNEVCVGGSTTLTNNTTIDYGNIDTYAWDFDDNNAVSSLSSLSRVFSVDGTFNVSLIVTSDQACADTLVQSVVVNPYPQTNFSIGDICFVDTLKPINTSTINLGTVSYVWNFGDGSTSIQKNPRHKYVSTDSYILTLTSTSNKGCSTSKNQTITVNPSPIANFVVPDICDSTEAKFQGVSSISSGTMTHFWDFGDGDTNYNEINPIHLYDGYGTYQVQLKVVSDKSCEDSVVKDIKVFHNPNLDITAVNPLCFSGLTGSISAQSSMGMAPYFYSLNGGSFTLVPVFKMLGAGTYSLLVMDNRNCVTKSTIELTQPDKLNYTVANITDVKCAGASTGSYVVLPQGGTQPYSFLVNKVDSDTNIFKFELADTGYFANLNAKS